MTKSFDYPNLTHWKHVEEFTLEQVALLLAMIDPFDFSLDVARDGGHPRWKIAHGFKYALISAVRQGTLTLVRCVGYNGVSPSREPFDPDLCFDIKQSDRTSWLSMRYSIITRSALYGWIEREKIQYIKPPKVTSLESEHNNQIDFISEQSPSNIDNKQETIITTNCLQLPYYGHKSDGLDYVEDAIKQFWSTYDPNDPNTAPTQKEIVDYLINKGATQNMAKAVNLILRPRDIPKRTRIKQYSDT